MASLGEYIDGLAGEPPAQSGPPSLGHFLDSFVQQPVREAREFIAQRASQRAEAELPPKIGESLAGLGDAMPFAKPFLGMVGARKNPQRGQDDLDRWGVTEGEFKKQFPGL